MEKITGQELKKELENTEIKLSNLNNKINKKFQLIIEEYSKFIPALYLNYLDKNSIYDLDSKAKLDIIIQTEDNYVKQTGNQISLFE